MYFYDCNSDVYSIVARKSELKCLEKGYQNSIMFMIRIRFSFLILFVNRSE